MTQFTAEEIKAHTKVKTWPLRDCSMCGTWLHYVFNGDDVCFDSNCDCVSYWTLPRARSWADVAETINMQSDEVQKRMLAELAGVSPATDRAMTPVAWRGVVDGSTAFLCRTNDEVERLAADYNATIEPLFTHPLPPPNTVGNGELDAAGLEAICKPWEFGAGDPPDYESPLTGVYEAGISYAFDQLAGMFNVKKYTGSDGAGTLEGDVAGTLQNILIAAGFVNADGDLAAPVEVVGEPLHSQIDRLANFIMAEVPGEPSQSEGAVDTAIRWMRNALAAPSEIARLQDRLKAWELQAQGEAKMRMKAEAALALRPSDSPALEAGVAEEELCKVLVKIWGYKWVEFEDIPLPDAKDRDRIADAYSARLNAQDAVRGLLRRYIINPRPAALSIPAKEPK